VGEPASGARAGGDVVGPDAAEERGVAVQRGHAPCGELKEKMRGSSSTSEGPCSGQAKRSENVKTVPGSGSIPGVIWAAAARAPLAPVARPGDPSTAPADRSSPGTPVEPEAEPPPTTSPAAASPPPSVPPYRRILSDASPSSRIFQCFLNFA